MTFIVNVPRPLTIFAMNKLAEVDYFKFLSNSAHRKRLKNLNIEKDTIFCLNPNISSSIIPILVDGRLVPMNL